MNRFTVCIAALAAALAGCAVPMQQHKTDNSVPRERFDPYAECVVPTVRDAGLGVKVEGCHAWSFGPTATQRVKFNGRWRNK